MNISIFSIPKAFVGRSAIHQNNAIATWHQLPTHPEIILCGNDPGVAEAVQRFGGRHLPNIQCTAQGTPLLNDAFAQVQAIAKCQILVYVNADILLLPDFVQAVEQVAQQHSQFLMLGRRWNLDVEQPIDFEGEKWRSQLLEDLRRQGIFSGIGALDYFAFPSSLFAEIPPFAVGRAGWDNWMVGEALSQGYSVVNASQAVTVIHQNHDYAHLPGKRLEAFHGVEAKQNRTFLKSRLAGNSANATHVLSYHNKSPRAKSPRVSIILAQPAEVTEPAAQEIALEQAIKRLKEQAYSNFEIVLPEPCLQNPVAAWNKSLAKAKGEFVLFLDTRTHLLPKALAEWIEQIDMRAGSLEISLAGWQTASAEMGSSDDNAFIEIEPWQELARLLSGREGLQGLHIWALPTIWLLLHPSSMLFRRDWLARFSTSGFGASIDTSHAVLNEHLHDKAAIVDLVLRLFSRGAAASYLEASVLQDSRIADGAQYNSHFAETLQKDCNQIVNDFFKQAHIPRWAAPLEAHARLTTQQWIEKLTDQATDASAASESMASPQFL